MFANFQAWLSHPFKGGDKMSALDWFYFLGLLIVLMVLWRILLRHLFEFAE